MQVDHANEPSLRVILELLRRLSPSEILEAEAAVREARQRAETLVEIDEAGADRSCRHCGDDRRARWGRTRTGAQRWRCAGCRRTWSGLTGTPVAGVHRPMLLMELVRDMMGDAPRSCRKIAKALGISRHTAWRWRMKVLAALPQGPSELFQGVVEADETFQRESRKGSREWSRHKADPSQPKPPRLRWSDYGREGPPRAVAKKFQRAVLGAADRSGRVSLSHLANTRQAAIGAVLVAQLAPDAFLLSDGAPQYGAIAKTKGWGHRMLVAGRRSSHTPATYHLSTVNALHSRWKAFLRPFCGPASKNLDAYARWMIARRDGYLPAFRSLLA